MKQHPAGTIAPRGPNPFYEVNLNGVIAIFSAVLQTIHGIGYGIWTLILSSWTMSKAMQAYAIFSIAMGVFNAATVFFWSLGCVSETAGKHTRRPVLSRTLVDCGVACRCATVLPLVLHVVMWLLGAAFFIFINFAFWPRCYYERACDAYYYYLQTWSFYGIAVYSVCVMAPMAFCCCISVYSYCVTRYIQGLPVYLL